MLTRKLSRHRIANRSAAPSSDRSASLRASAEPRTSRRRFLLAAATLPSATLPTTTLTATALTTAALSATALTAAPRSARAQASGLLTVAAASDLKFALEDIAARFERDSGQKLRLVFGASGTFFSQILQGAPFQLYLSADESFVFRLADAGRTRDRGRLYAIGRVGIIVPRGSALKADSSLNDLAAALGDGRLKRFAIANPEHAPYGARAREVLEHRKLWSAIEPRLIIGENLSQATQFALSGGAQGGITSHSLALAPTIARQSDFALLPQDWHQPLRQRMVLLKDAPTAAQRFYDYLAAAPAQEILSRYGFETPDPAWTGKR